MDYRNPLQLAAFCLASVTALGSVRGDSPFDAAPIRYAMTEASDPIARLKLRLERGELALEYEPGRGYLRSLLRELKAPVSSQGLVFSKTSFQRSRISPRTPRAIYFGDDVYVGWVPGGEVIELSGVDPNLGAVFYQFEQRVQDPRLRRTDESCLLCHSSFSGKRIPSHVVRSVFVDRSGTPLTGTARYRTDHASPFEQRWGGWYVTGQHGDQRHLGNVTFDSLAEAQRGGRFQGNLEELGDRFDTSRYLSPHSDVVALMVLEHQTLMHNTITAANFEARRVLHAASRADNAKQSNSTKESEAKRALSLDLQKRLDDAAESVVHALLFVGESKLTDPVSSSTEFAKVFAARGKRDSSGRSLRDLDLRTRLFKHPCSYLIDSPSFDQLPGPLLARIYARLWQVIGGGEDDTTFDHLTASDRQAIREILLETKAGLPASWRQPRR